MIDHFKIDYIDIIGPPPTPESDAQFHRIIAELKEISKNVKAPFPGHRKIVSKFWIQPTPSFPEAPQREEYTDDATFDSDRRRYEEEWRAIYFCNDGNCQNRDCPQHWPSPAVCETTPPNGYRVRIIKSRGKP